ncbi:hypothetical protein [Symbioplanes lichenis]|uniref:hypothetical protein n=1 Tax=Symbioplanes lichenis TaxID=1629072 RepID=UPI0027384CB6|nr:hypothetical protein [Actinoplanes lichenis]
MQRAVLAGIVLSLLASGAAFGYWSTAGGGTGTAAASAPSPITLTPGTPAGLLYPGGTADLAVTITNPNTYAVRVPQLARDPLQGTGGYAVDAGHSACGVGALSYTTQTNGGSGWTVPASGSLTLALTGALSLAGSAANACQGATFRVYLGTGSGV